MLLVRGLLLFVAALPAWRTEQALAAGLDDKGAGELQEAKRLYKSGKYEQASEIFSRLSAAHPDFPIFASNAGACYYYLQRAEPAISNLREYLLVQKRITPEDRAEVEGWIAEMEKLRDQNAPIPSPTVGPAPVQASPSASSYSYGPSYPSAPAPAPTAIVNPSFSQLANPRLPSSNGVQPSGYSSPSSPQPTPSPQVAYGYAQGYPQSYPPAPEPSQQPHPSQPLPPLAYRYTSPSHSAAPADAAVDTRPQGKTSNNSAAPWVVGGLGVALLVTGGVFTYLSQSSFSDTVKQYDSGKEGNGKDQALVAGFCYGAGAASVVTAAILLLARDHHSSGSVALAPVLRPDTVGAVVHYAY